jgi:hypothetical protein
MALAFSERHWRLAVRYHVSTFRSRGGRRSQVSWAWREAAGMNDGPLPRITGLSKIHGDLPTVDRVDLQVTQGENVVLIGPSGGGCPTI